MDTEKKFAKAITKTFNKKSVLRNTKGIVADGFVLYRGDLWKDIFYRLRLEMDGQMELMKEVLEGVFTKSEAFEFVELDLLYTLPEGTDVYEVERENTPKKEYIAFDEKYRSLLRSLSFEYSLNAANPNKEMLYTLVSGVQIETPFGEVFVMPKKIELDKLYYRK